MSILLDTNVLSELLRAQPSQAVLAWFTGQAAHSLFVSAVTQAEMTLGAVLLPPGKRRSGIETALAAIFSTDFAGRILPFDSSAVPAYARIVSERRSAGRPVSQFDAQIAAIALTHRMRVATRNQTDFEGCGLVLVDPWSHAH